MLSRFGDGEDGGRIDAQALLSTLGLEPAGTPPLSPASARATSRPKRNPWAVSEIPSSARGERVFAAPVATGHVDSEVETIGSGLGTDSSNGLDGRTGDDLGRLVDHGDQPAEPPPPAYEDVVKRPNDTAVRASADDEGFEPGKADGGDGDSDNGDVDGRSDADHGVSTRSIDYSGDGAAATVDAAAVEAENARLRSQLAVFDLGFFEEVEDLKYSYASLKREAEKLAKRQGVDLAASLGLPEAGEEPWDRTVDVAHHTVDWAETFRRRPPGSPSSPPRGAHASRLFRRWNGLSPRPTAEQEGEEEQGEGEPREDEDEGFPPGTPPRGSAGATTTTDPGVQLFRSAPGRGGRWAGRGRQGASPAPPPPRNGLIAAHERKLAWELSAGGMGSLACLRESAGRLDRSGSGFGSDKQVLSALREAGYALELEDVAVLRTGLGSTADGKVDLKEFMGMCEDIASGEEWYVPAAGARRAATAVLSPAASRSPDGRSGAAAFANSLPADMFLQEGGRGTSPGRGGFGSHAHELRAATGGRNLPDDGFFPSSATPPARPAGMEPLFLGGTAYGDRVFLEPSKSANEVLAEMKDQLTLLDIEDLFPPSLRRGTSGGSGTGHTGGGAVTLGQAVGARFSRRDPAQSGLLSARELGLALEDVGVSLRPDEVVTLARKFKPPGDHTPRERQRRQHQGFEGSPSRPGRAASPSATKSAPKPAAADSDAGGELDGVVAEYAPLVRLVVDCLAEAGGIDPAVGGRAKLGQRGMRMRWNERMPAPARRLKVALSGGAGGGDGWLERLRQRYGSRLSECPPGVPGGTGGRGWALASGAPGPAVVGAVGCCCRW